ncbi:MAG: hypothetical protein AAGD25_32395 [Cyanobacteria bacterium P01_F01_bin.150]
MGYIELIPIEPNIPLPFRVEAEDMDLSLYQAERESGASGKLLPFAPGEIEKGVELTIKLMP